MHRTKAVLLLGTVLFGLFGPSFAFAQGLEQAKPWLGIAIDPAPNGVLVKEVLAGTPAEQHGLKSGDVVTAINEKAVASPEDLIKTVQSNGVGNTVVVHFLRAGKAETKSIPLVARPDQLDVIRKKLVGKPVPPFDLKVVSGKDPGSTAALKGRVIIVEFWATWCPACRMTHARLSELAKAKPELAIVAITDEEEADIKAYIDATKPAFTILRDTDQKTQADWMVSAIPMIVVIDKKGDVAFATIGAGSYLEEAIAEAEKLLK